MRFDNNFRFFYSFIPKPPNYDEFITCHKLPDTKTSFRIYSNILNNRHDLEKPHSKIKVCGPLISSYNNEDEISFNITRIYVFDTSDDMNRDYIAKCTGTKREKLLHLHYKHNKLKGEI